MNSYTLELNSEEVRVMRAALSSYLHDFGHDEGDVLRSVKQLIAKLPHEAGQAPQRDSVGV